MLCRRRVGDFFYCFFILRLRDTTEVVYRKRSRERGEKNGERINARYNNRGLRTIFSGERGLNEIMDIDEAMGSRIYQRCGKYKLKIGWGEGRNYRTREELEV